MAKTLNWIRCQLTEKLESFIIFHQFGHPMSNSGSCETASTGKQGQVEDLHQLDHLSTGVFFRRFNISSSTSQIELCVAQRPVGEEGAVVWDAAIVLAYFIEKHQLKFNFSRPIHVIELGAGTGIVGLVAGALGARVTLTDFDRFIPFLNETIGLNAGRFGKDLIKAQPLHWNNPEHSVQLLKDPPDLILVADCIYYEFSLEPLVTTLLTLTSGREYCPVLMSYEVRDDFEDKRVVKEKFFDLVRSSFFITEYSTSDCHPEFAADDIKVILLERRRNL